MQIYVKKLVPCKTKYMNFKKTDWIFVQPVVVFE